MKKIIFGVLLTGMFTFTLSKTLKAQSGAGDLCLNNVEGWCSWYNADGTLDFQCDGAFVPEKFNLRVE